MLEARNSVQAVINDIYKTPRVGFPELIAEISEENPYDLMFFLVFRSGVTYCCAEPGCFLGLHDSKKWSAIDFGLQKIGIYISNMTTIRVFGTVEKGSLLKHGGKMGIPEIKTYKYTAEYKHSFK